MGGRGRGGGVRGSVRDMRRGRDCAAGGGRGDNHIQNKLENKCIEEDGGEDKKGDGYVE